MKKVGIIGGLGPASTLEYYKDIIERVRAIKGEEIYPEISLESISLSEFLKSIEEGDYDKAVLKLLRAIDNLKSSDAEFVAIASNTPHIVLDKVLEKSSLPIMSIVDANAEYIKEKNYKRVMIIGTKYTMKSRLYEKALRSYNIETFIPSEEDMDTIYGIITPNLENGIVIPAQKSKMIQISEKYIKKYNADSILLGCTEIPLMIKDKDMSVPVISTTDVHINAIVNEILK